jgi:hypothetical protein
MAMWVWVAPPPTDYGKQNRRVQTGGFLFAPINRAFWSHYAPLVTIFPAVGPRRS